VEQVARQVPNVTAVSDLGASKDGQAAEALGMSTTAEGIETVELATTLATLGCASGQGFYFAKPLEADAALKYWKSRKR